MDKKASALSVVWRRSLSADGAAALAAFKAGEGRLMNFALRGEIDRPATLRAAHTLNLALLHSVMGATLRAYRVVDFFELQAIEALTPGAVLRRAGFTSATLDAATASRLLQEQDSGGVVEIIIPKGFIGAAYIDGAPRPEHHEFEVLIAAGARFRYGGIVDGRVILEAI